jgi:two-component system, OmpR family, alkaline phosphatase synthesis response regulator PhoP
MHKKIFIIEDDVNILFGLQAKLSVEGFTVTVENGNSSAEEIMEKIREVTPDAIVLDLILPSVDGFQLLMQIKSDRDTSDTPVFVFTNLSDEDSRNKGLSLGVDHYLIKQDLNIDAFVDKVKKILENRDKVGKN